MGTNSDGGLPGFQRRVASPARTELEPEQEILQGFPPPASQAEMDAFDKEILEHPFEDDPNDGQESFKDSVNRWLS